jgi:hypothetical protein
VTNWSPAKLFLSPLADKPPYFSTSGPRHSLKMGERINITYRNYILGTILKCAEETKNNEYYVEEVGEDGSPHIA